MRAPIHSHEQPKILYSQKRWRVLWEFAVWHFLPMAITLSEFGLYITGVYWDPPGPGTTILNTLQVAAQAHAALIVTSLSLVLLHHTRYRLLRGDGSALGVRLGLLTSSYQLTSPSYLFTEQFSSAFPALSPKDVATLSMHVFLFVLAAASGPSAAIVMLPKLEWWPAPRLVQRGYIAAPFTALYPGEISSSFSPVNCTIYTTDGANPRGYLCPYDGLRIILSSLTGPDTTFVDHLTMGFLENMGFVDNNLTLALHETNRTRNIHTTWLGWQDFQVKPLLINRGAAYATTPMDAVNRAAADGISMWLSGPSPRWFASANDATGPHTWKQPVVAAQCVGGEGQPQSRSSFQFPYPPETLGRGDTVQVSVDPDSPASHLGSSGAAFLDLDALNITPQMRMSAAFATSSYANDSLTTLCLASARWVDADVWVASPQTAADFAIWQPLVLDPEVGNNSGGGGDTQLDIIKLDLQWLRSLDRSLDSSSNVTYFTNISRDCGDRSDCMAIGLAVGIAEALSRVTHHFGYVIVDEDYWSNYTLYQANTSREEWGGTRSGPFNQAQLAQITANYTHITFDATQNVYGYGFKNATVYIAFAVLFLHVATVLAHLLIVLLGRRWSSSAWRTLGELLVLALQSPSAAAPQNAAATWRLWASVEVLPDNKGVGLVLREGAAEGAVEMAVPSGTMPLTDWTYDS